MCTSQNCHVGPLTERAILSEQTKKRLAWEDGGKLPQTPEQITELFRGVGLPCHQPVAVAFSVYGGGRFCHTQALDTQLVQIERFKTKYRIVYASEVLRQIKGTLKRHPHQFDGYDVPDTFRIGFAGSNRCHEAFTLDGHGRVYEAEILIAPSIEAWIESFAR